MTIRSQHITCRSLQQMRLLINTLRTTLESPPSYVWGSPVLRGDPNFGEPRQTAQVGSQAIKGKHIVSVSGSEILNHVCGRDALGVRRALWLRRSDLHVGDLDQPLPGPDIHQPIYDMTSSNG